MIVPTCETCGCEGRRFTVHHETVSDWFRKASEAAAHAVGSHWAFLIAVCVIIGWAIAGPIFGFSDVAAW